MIRPITQEEIDKVEAAINQNAVDDITDDELERYNEYQEERRRKLRERYGIVIPNKSTIATNAVRSTTAQAPLRGKRKVTG